MILIEEIKKAVTNLPPDDYNDLRDWFAEYDAMKWDKQIEEDIKKGKMDILAKEALEDYKNGNYTEL